MNRRLILSSNTKEVITFLVALFLVLAPGRLLYAEETSQFTKHAIQKEPVILVYHSVEPKTDKQQSKLQKHYHVYPEKFRAQMEYLRDNGYVPIPMKIYLRYLNQGISIPDKSVVITFDDGWKNQYQYAFPILKEFGYTATFYILSGAAGTPSYVTWDQVRELRDAGMDIQSHTKTHANLVKIAPEKAIQELIDSRRTIEQQIERPVVMLAYPYYANNEIVHRMVAEAGYTAARAGWTKTRNSQETLLTLKSQEAVNATNPFSSVPDKQ